MIRQVVEAVNIPVFGNGNVKDIDSANEMFEKTGCAGIAVGRAAIGAPYIFSTLNGKKAKYTLVSLIKSHISKMSEYIPTKVVVNYMKKHIAAYLMGIPKSKEIKTKFMQFLPWMIWWNWWTHIKKYFTKILKFKSIYLMLLILKKAVICLLIS